MSLAAEITKDDINKLPLAEFHGEVHLIESESQLEDAISAMKHCPVLGFDTETRPAFKKGQSYPVALLQLASEDQVWLFRLNKLGGLPEALAKFLEAPQLKLGVAVRDDIKGLQKLHDFDGRYISDLSTMAKKNQIKALGLRALMAICCGLRISKGAKVTNWAAETLTPAQIKYAAVDAWAGLKIYQRFQEEGLKDIPSLQTGESDKV